MRSLPAVRRDGRRIETTFAPIVALLSIVAASSQFATLGFLDPDGERVGLARPSRPRLAAGRSLRPWAAIANVVRLHVRVAALRGRQRPRTGSSPSYS